MTRTLVSVDNVLNIANALIYFVQLLGCQFVAREGAHIFQRNLQFSPVIRESRRHRPRM